MTNVQHFSAKVNKATIIAFCENSLYARVFKTALPVLIKLGYSVAKKRSKSPHYTPPKNKDYTEALTNFSDLIDAIQAHHKKAN